MKMSFEAKYTKICRTCLTENCNMKSVFSVEDVMEQPTVLCDILMSCASVQVLKGDGLPEQVCLGCAQEMNRAFLFRKLCEKSDITLRNCLSLLPVTADGQHPYSTTELQDVEKIDTLHSSKSESYTSENDLFENDDFKNNSFSGSDSEGSSDEDIYEIKRKRRKKKEVEKIDDEPKRKKYSCKICDETCIGLGAYRHHMALYHGQIHKCETCGKEFKIEALLVRHMAIHEPEVSENEEKQIKAKKKPYKRKTGIIKKRNLPRTCTICNKTFRFHSNLERHKLIHTGEKPYLCNVCGKGFAQLSYLKIHSFIHTGEKPYKCQMCNKSFAAPGTLMTHIRTHTGERPHVCKICGKDFPQSGYLSAHIRTHTGEKPVECQVCHRRFNQSGRLIIHMRIHSGEKPYSCKECGRSFAVKGTLKKHIRTHTGERPYICTMCGQAFAQSGTLATHMKVHKPK